MCQQHKREHLHPAGLLQSLEVPSAVWADIAMDFMEGFPKGSGESVILTVVDRFSKYAHFIPLGHPYTATSMACLLHGNRPPPQLPLLYCQRQRPNVHEQFLVGVVQMIQCRPADVNGVPAFHPQTDRQSEPVNKTQSPCTFIAWPEMGHSNGCRGCRGLSFAIIQSTRPCCARRLSGSCTGVILR
jgi:hypothetical protein